MKTLLVVVVAALALAGGAAAKELRAVTVCGADGCRTIHDASVLRELSAQMAEPPAGTLDALPARPHYRFGLDLKGDRTKFEGFSFVVDFFPPDVLRPSVHGKPAAGVFRLSPQSAALFRSLTAGREPFAAARTGAGWRKPAAIGLVAVWLPVLTGLIVRARRRRSA